MNEYLLLNLAVVGILAGAALLVVGVILIGRANVVHDETRKLLEQADAKRLAGESVYWAALDAVRPKSERGR